jgi:hypothetical protein
VVNLERFIYPFGLYSSMNSKKGQSVGPTTVFIVMISLIFIAWLIIYSQRECHSNADCDADAYCGADFSCHKYPQITQTIRRSDFTGAAFLVGLAIVAAAIILRRKQSVPRDNIEPKVIRTKGDSSHDEHAHTPHSHHPEEHHASRSALEKFEKGHSKDSQNLEKYGEDAHSHTPKHH